MKTIVASMWDDGLTSDLRLMEILNKHNITACFALSPNRYKNVRTQNDHRDEKYGELISIKELLYFKNFEICNHSANHYDLKYLNKNQTETEIKNSHNLLEETFSRPIKGFCYPYGEKNIHCDEILKNLKYKYARTTSDDKNCPLDLSPTCKWNDNRIHELLGLKNILFWGHTYELKTEKNWEEIEELYNKIKHHPNIKIVTVEQFSELNNAFF